MCVCVCVCVCVCILCNCIYTVRTVHTGICVGACVCVHMWMCEQKITKLLLHRVPYIGANFFTGRMLCEPRTWL